MKKQKLNIRDYSLGLIILFILVFGLYTFFNHSLSEKSDTIVNCYDPVGNQINNDC